MQGWTLFQAWIGCINRLQASDPTIPSKSPLPRPHRLAAGVEVVVHTCDGVGVAVDHHTIARQMLHTVEHHLLLGIQTARGSGRGSRRSGGAGAVSWPLNSSAASFPHMVRSRRSSLRGPAPNGDVV